MSGTNLTAARAGELLMVGFEGTEIDDRIHRYIRQWRVGGVILFDRNIRDPLQLAELCRGLQALRRQVSDTPLLIAVDQEGGTVARVREGATVFPGNLALGLASPARDARLQGRFTGRELRRLGINMNLAPVLDLYRPGGGYSLGLRPLGADPERVALLGTALIAGMQEEGIAAVAKHFPGKGGGRVDSHRELPVIEESAESLRSGDLVPFRRAVAAGVKAVMTSHAAYPALDGGRIRPGTLSAALMTGLLRDELGFAGVLITDDLGMGAIRGESIEMAVREGLGAGVDIFLLCHSPEERERAFAELARLAGGADASRCRIEESGARIAALKIGLPTADPPPAETVPAAALALRIARSAITFSSSGPRPPSLPRKFCLVWFQPERTVEVESSSAGEGDPGRIFRMAGLDPAVIAGPLDPNPEERAAIRARLADRGAVLVSAYDAWRFPGQRELIGEILRQCSGAILAVVRDPRDAELFPAAKSIVITRGFGGYSLRALAEALAGQREC